MRLIEESYHPGERGMTFQKFMGRLLNWPTIAAMGDCTLAFLLPFLGGLKGAPMNSLLHAFFFTAILIFLFLAFDLYQPWTLDSSNRRKMIKSVLTLFIIVLFYPLAVQVSTLDPFLTSFFFPLPLLLLWRLFLLPRLLEREKIIVIGSGKEAGAIVNILNENPIYECVGNISQEELKRDSRVLESKYWGNPSPYDIDKVIIALEEQRGVLPVKVLLNYRLSGVEIQSGNAFFEKALGKINLRDFRPNHIIYSDGFKKRWFTLKIKRLMDIVFSLVGLIVTSPLMLVTAILIKLESKGPIIFRQIRLGQGGRPFIVYKFRSMCLDAEKDGAKWAEEEDDRVTRIGRIMRPAHIDELTQLWNIIKGDMSLIGPRPERPEFIRDIEKYVPYYKLRLIFKPGFTGWAQINYRYGNTLEDALEKMQYDFYYIKNWSLSLDFFILLKTIKLLKGEGAY